MKDKIIKCPRCSVDMKKITRNDVTIDVCRKCRGMWLDDGEIEKLASMKEGFK